MQMIVRRIIALFADDSDLVTIARSRQSTLQRLLMDLAHDAQLWSDLLTASGGALELMKCFFFLARWTQDEWGIPHNRRQRIEQKRPDEVHKTLGVWKTLSGDNKREVQRRLDISRKWAQHLTTSNFKR